MAQIVTITNPLTGQPAQVDQLDHTAQQIDDGIGFESTDYPGCYYRTVEGVTEWVNPPMILGVEYRTTERYQGKPVYVMSVNAENLPVASIKTVDLATTARIFECNGYINVNNYMTIPARNINGGSEYIDVYGEYNHIKIVTSADRSSWSAIVTAKYTKTTD